MSLDHKYPSPDAFFDRSLSIATEHLSQRYRTTIRRHARAKENSNSMELSPSTWRVLGLSATAACLGLGSFAITSPALAAKVFGIYPEETAASSSSTDVVGEKKGWSKAEQTHAEAVSTSMRLLGARDLTIGIALLWLDYQRNPPAMGALILSGFALCIVDVYIIWERRGSATGSAFAAIAAVWMAIGYGLLQQ